jgi:hypothetical protein
VSSRSRAAASVAALLPLFVVVVAAAGVPTMLRALFGALFLTVALVVVARGVAAGRR